VIGQDVGAKGKEVDVDTDHHPETITSRSQVAFAAAQLSTLYFLVLYCWALPDSL